MFVTGLVLAAGGSRRLGVPKQLLPYRSSTLLGATLAMARSCGFDELLVTVGSRSSDIRARVELAGCRVVENLNFDAGCSSSIAAALRVIDTRSNGLVLLLGDQPGIQATVIRQLVTEAGQQPIGVCRYADGRGHPFWFDRSMFAELSALHGDKAVWKLLESGRFRVHEIVVAGPAPRDVDTEEDYRSLLARDAADS